MRGRAPPASPGTPGRAHRRACSHRLTWVRLPSSPPAPEEPAARPDEPERKRPLCLAVYDLDGAGIEPHVGRVVTSSVVEELRKLQRVSVISMDEVRAMLDREAQKQLMGFVCPRAGRLRRRCGAGQRRGRVHRLRPARGQGGGAGAGLRRHRKRLWHGRGPHGRQRRGSALHGLEGVWRCEGRRIGAAPSGPGLGTCPRSGPDFCLPAVFRSRCTPTRALPARAPSIVQAACSATKRSVCASIGTPRGRQTPRIAGLVVVPASARACGSPGTTSRNRPPTRTRASSTST